MKEGNGQPPRRRVETEVLTRGFDPQLSVGSARPHLANFHQIATAGGWTSRVVAAVPEQAVRAGR